jgi:hypothetical protein
MNPDELWSYIHYETDYLWHEAYKLATMVRIFACMSIEAFLNYYGTKCLGEDFYKQNIERLRISKKIAIIVALCSQSLIGKKDQLLIRLEAFFEIRNQLVHPKSRKIDFSKIDDFSNKNPKELDLSQVIKELDQILISICQLDPEIDFEFEFKRPNIYMAAEVKRK